MSERILAIDTSCDDTSVAITQGRRIRSNVVSSQIKEHAQYGGVVPFLAQRLHRERLPQITARALKQAGLVWEDIDCIAVTYGPGLAPALQEGIQWAQDCAKEHNKPLRKVNHMLGHIASCFPEPHEIPEFPFLAVLVSGNHSELVYVQAWDSCRILGATLDDSLGEAYDKVARMVGLGYPGGPVLAELSHEADPAIQYDLPVPMIRSGDLNLSYSGLKNAMRLLVESLQPLSRETIAALANNFERVAQESLLRKVALALDEYPEISVVVLAGGVSANRRLRAVLRSQLGKQNRTLLTPPARKLCGDNAAMIGIAAHLLPDPVDLSVPLDRVPGLRFARINE